MSEDGFDTKFDPSGSSRLYSTYVGFNASSTAPVLAFGSDGTVYAAGPAGIMHLNSTGTAALVTSPPVVAAQAITNAADGGVYLAGPPGTTHFHTTVGVFQSLAGFPPPLLSASRHCSGSAPELT